MIAVVLALLAAASNALASVLQRRAARTMPAEKAFRPALILALLRKPVWIGGIIALIGGFVFQASALSQGGLTLVQPILVTELPFTLLLLPHVLGVRLDRRSGIAAALMTAGLAMFLVSAAPGPGLTAPTALVWVLTGLATFGLIAGLVVVAEFTANSVRAAALGIAAGVGFALTATFMKESTTLLKKEPGELATSWEIYAMVITGLLSLYLLENALQSGPLVAAQPALTISDPVASILYGTMLYGEDIRTGPLVVPELTGILMIVYGTYLLCRCAAFRAHAARTH